ncbi:MAG: bifunctional oligoribonuclease/PAP phosphatase NrnA [Kiritimatiellae bacterium]|nr:bifunctional oligoribonuclease/PAP phosphatase NrnA [Kiritimatiellia bacterium]
MGKEEIDIDIGIDKEEKGRFKAALDAIGAASRILVTGHLSPDGDSAGCMVALVRMLRAAGRQAWASAEAKALGKLCFLDGTGDFLSPRKLKGRKFDLLVAVDCASPERMPPEIRPVASAVKTVCIDHHIAGDVSFGDVRIIDSNASSAGEMVWRLARYAGWGIDASSAEALWTAIVTDTGRFAYESTSPATLRIAADLLARGVRTSYINDVIYGVQPRRAIELKRRAWRSLHVWKNRLAAEVSLKREDFREVRGTKADVEDVIEIPRSVAGVKIALFFYEIPDRTEETRCSIRTRGDIDATAIAGVFGGGGHLRAAGCTIAAPIASARRMMRKAVGDMFGAGGRS